jgi:sodium transport system permease protein
VRVSLIQNSTSSSSSAAAAEVQAALAHAASVIVAQRLVVRGIDPALLTPLQVTSTDVSTTEERGGVLLSVILPLFIVMWAIAGSMYTAMDISAGEKERATLESLLLTPCMRLEITLGKLLAVASVAFVSIVAALLSMLISLSRYPIPTAGGHQFHAQFDPAILPLIVVLGILLALAFAALELGLSVLARSYKEAQSYIMPLYLLTVLPVAVISGIPSFKPPLWLFLVPAINAVSLFKAALIGHTQAVPAAVTLIALLAFALASATLTVALFGREKVLLTT